MLWQYAARDMYYILNVNAGVAPIEADFFARMRRWLVISCVVEIFFYTILIMFKLSMLFFFKRLGTSVDRFNYLWWPILLFSLSTFFVSIGDVEYKCLFGDLNTITVYCNSPSAISFLRVTLNVNAALDVLSDFLSGWPQTLLGMPMFKYVLTAADQLCSSLLSSYGTSRSGGRRRLPSWASSRSLLSL